MNTQRHVLAFRLAAFLATIPSLMIAGEDVADNFLLQRAIFTTKVNELKIEHLKRLKALPDSYAADLKLLQKKIQNSGDLEGWLAVKTEMERFEKDPRIPPNVPDGAPALYRTVFDKYETLRHRSEAERDAGVRDITEKYAAYLKRVQRKLTIAGKMEEAIKVRAEVQRIESGADAPVGEAETVGFGDEADAFGGPEADVVPPAEEPVPESDAPADRDDEDWEGVIAPEGVKVYRPGEKPPTIAGEVYKRESLKTTTHSPIARTAAVVAARRTRERGRVTEHFVRVMARSTSTEKVFENPTVTVEFFGKPIRKRASHINPEVKEAQLVKLPRLGVQGVYIDCRSVPGGFDWEDMEYYGIVVSIYDREENLLFQATSNAHLENSATPAMPRETVIEGN